MSSFAIAHPTHDRTKQSQHRRELFQDACFLNQPKGTSQVSSMHGCGGGGCGVSLVPTSSRIPSVSRFRRQYASSGNSPLPSGHTLDGRRQRGQQPRIRPQKEKAGSGNGRLERTSPPVSSSWDWEEREKKRCARK